MNCVESIFHFPPTSSSHKINLHQLLQPINYQNLSFQLNPFDTMKLFALLFSSVLAAVAASDYTCDVSVQFQAKNVRISSRCFCCNRGPDLYVNTDFFLFLLARKQAVMPATPETVWTNEISTNQGYNIRLDDDSFKSFALASSTGGVRGGSRLLASSFDIHAKGLANIVCKFSTCQCCMIDKSFRNDDLTSHTYLLPSLLHLSSVSPTLLPTCLLSTLLPYLSSCLAYNYTPTPTFSPSRPPILPPTHFHILPYQPAHSLPNHLYPSSIPHSYPPTLRPLVWSSGKLVGIAHFHTLFLVHSSNISFF